MAGSSIIEEHRSSPQLFTLYSGWAFRFKTLSDGRRQILNFLLPGDFIGLQDEFADKDKWTAEALEGAGRDALCFEAFVQHKDEATANALLESDRFAQEVGNLLGEELGEIEGVIHPIAGGDLACARILLAAAREVQDLIAAENQRAADDIELSPYGAPNLNRIELQNYSEAAVSWIDEIVIK